MSSAKPSASESVPEVEPASWDWTALDERLRPSLMKIALFRYGFRADEAEDIVQDVFEAVWARRPRVRSPEAYLRTSFHHRCADVLSSPARRSERRSAPLSESLVDRAGPEAILDGCAVRGALNHLNAECRQLVDGYIVNGDTLAETAAKVGSTVTAVWKRVNRCLKRLIQWLT